ncbi:divergent polysaccharide deacetylase family protein [Oceanicaulis sp. MMSF_3324]|uniref:divergent polysaccharide deacetylase family protein n=1 Tax=Oceanicaulis sp. MMSF_3324 TaxID=3046702 RepID=UPI00273DC77A|nr:divergent polysaccharide deacetylase family protein [Oceanicaulis sp. MMSF_3324]
MRTASYAPHLGSALAAGFMLVAALAYNLGAKTAQTDALALEAAGLGEAEAAAFWPGVIRVDATQRIDADIATLSGIASPTDADVPTSRPVLTERRPQLAVIIDDVGLDVEVARQLMALEAPVTLSILPYAEAAPTLAAEALASGREVFLHLPMEPVGVEDPGPYALTEFQSAEEMASRIRWAFSRVPGASGFNNHMGSRLTSDQRAMDAVFAATQWPESMIFVDSLTHPRSQAAHSAQSAGLRALTRDVFLDHERDEAAVSDQLNRALALAIQNGQAIAIGHPRPETLSVLADLSRRAEAVGVELVTVSGLDASDPVEADS